MFDLFFYHRKCGDKLSTVQEMTANMQLSNSHSSVSLDNETDEMPQDAARLEACLTQLRDVISEEVATRQQLVQVALAADYDLNRALNFFYSS